MTATQQPEAIRLAEWIESDMSCEGDAEISAELRRLHVRNAWLEAELVKESFRTASESNRADQMSRQHDMQAALNRDARNQLAQLTAQLEAIGAGGVESLRGAKPLTDEEIKAVWYECGIGIAYDIAPSQDDYDWARAIEKRLGIGA